jgi:DNA invertase Pin-like site-specific DNA recombinase
MFREFCTRFNLTPSGEAYIDRGKSGYNGSHRRKGQLGDLIDAAKQGKFEKGTIIVVEAWDRLGRLRPDRQTALVAELLQTGVSIGICRLGDIFSDDDFGTHKWTTLAIFAQLAHAESKQKSERIHSAWNKKRQRAREEGELLTSRLPAWLELVNGVIRPIPERVATIRRILQLTIDGCGLTRIVKLLTQEGVPAFGEAETPKPNRTRSKYSGKWRRHYVGGFAVDRRLLGEHQPRDDEGKPLGEMLPGYYPVVVEPELLDRAREAQTTRRYAGRKPGTVQGRVAVTNLFSGLLRIAGTGDAVRNHNKGSKDKPHVLLVPASAVEGRVSGTTFPLDAFQGAILSQLAEIDPATILCRKAIASRVDELRETLKGIRADIAGVQDSMKVKFSKHLVPVLDDLTNREETVAAQLQAEVARVAQPIDAAWAELPQAVAALDDEGRAHAAAILRRVISSIWCFFTGTCRRRFCAVQVRFHESEEVRNYGIAHVPARESYPAQEARTVVRAMRLPPGAVDLREPGCVEVLNQFVREAMRD